MLLFIALAPARDEILPEPDVMIGGGLITLEKVRVIVYRPDTER